MGCDIHIYVEQYDTWKGEWYALDKFWQEDACRFDVVYPHETHVAPLHLRNYAVFAWLASVRNDEGIAPICEPRGLPKDVSDVVDLAFWKCRLDAHTPSWFTVREILEASRWRNAGTPFVECVRALPAKFYNTSAKHLRLVFWFDN